MNLALKYRPNTFNEVAGQRIVIELLQKLIETKQFENKSYLFVGESGTGKTTTARIFANAINSGIGQPIEIDGASNNGIDDVRNLIESSKYVSLDSEYKVFIIDECHSITIQAWNAFLKLIEEPPSKCIFIFCTTEVHKVPKTILTRVQRFTFARVSLADQVERLSTIAEQEQIQIDKDALEYIAHLSNGCMRDAVVFLDNCSARETISKKDVEELLGYRGTEAVQEFIRIVEAKGVKDVLNFIDKLVYSGANFTNFIFEVKSYLLESVRTGAEVDIEFLYLMLKISMQLKRVENVKDYVEGELLLWICM